MDSRETALVKDILESHRLDKLRQNKPLPQHVPSAVAALDLRGLKCPLPALFARRALARKHAGEELAVLSDDPLAAIDVPHMCHEEGHTVVSIERRDAFVRLVVRRRADPLPSAS